MTPSASTSEMRELSQFDIANLEKARSKATASMVLGIIGIALFGLCALVAAPLGHSAKKQFNRYPLHAHAYGAGRATAGIALAWITIGLWVAFWVLIFGAIGAVS